MLTRACMEHGVSRGRHLMFASELLWGCGGATCRRPVVDSLHSFMETSHHSQTTCLQGSRHLHLHGYGETIAGDRCCDGLPVGIFRLETGAAGPATPAQDARRSSDSRALVRTTVSLSQNASKLACCIPRASYSSMRKPGSKAR